MKLKLEQMVDKELADLGVKPYVYHIRAYGEGSQRKLLRTFNEITIADGINTVLADKKLRIEMKAKGIQRIKEFSWKKAAKELEEYAPNGQVSFFPRKTNQELIGYCRLLGKNMGESFGNDVPGFVDSGMGGVVSPLADMFLDFRNLFTEIVFCIIQFCEAAGFGCQ